jgi:O-antigen/teichoic acid export membrane protein
MNLSSRSVRAAILLGSGSALNVVIGFISGLVLARLLGPNDFGTFTLAITIVAFVDIRGKLQLDQKFLREPGNDSDYFDTFFALNVGLSVLSFCFLLIVSVVIVILNRVDLAMSVAVIALVGLIDPITTVVRLSIEKQVAFGRVSAILTVVSVGQFGTSLMAAAAGMGLWSLLLGLLAGALINLTLFLWIAPRRPKLIMHRMIAREFIAYGLKYGLLFSFSAIALTYFDNLIVGLVAGTYVLGFYNRGYGTALWPNLLISAALTRISLLTYSQLQPDPARFAKAVSLVLWVLLTFTTPLGIFFLVNAPELIPTLYGVKWLPSVPIFQILAAFAILRPLWDEMISLLIATKRPGQMARLVFIQAAVLVLLSIPLTMAFGAIGTAISVVIAFGISAVFLLYFVRTQLRLELWESVTRPLLNNCLAAIAYMTLRMIMPLDSLVGSMGQYAPWARLAIEGAILMTVYSVISLLTSRDAILANIRYLAIAARG